MALSLAPQVRAQVHHYPCYLPDPIVEASPSLIAALFQAGTTATATGLSTYVGSLSQRGEAFPSEGMID